MLLSIPRTEIKAPPTPMCVCFEPRGLGSKAADKEMTGENTYA